MNSGEDYGYAAFFDSIDTTVQGTNTFKHAESFDPFPYAGKTNYVFTRNANAVDTQHARFITGDIANFVAELKRQPGKDIWLVGGGQINTVMLNAGLIDLMILTSFPIVLGAGIPLFAPGARQSRFTTVNIETFPAGLVQWTLALRA